MTLKTNPTRTKLSGWGRFPVLDARTLAPRGMEALKELVLSEPSLIARGNGRSYGDSAINTKATIETRHLNRMITFDPVSGQLVAEAGVLLCDIIDVFLPRGWFLLITPGTKFVTIGGAIAADVHGKNHHKEGSFRSCVDWIDVMGSDGVIQRCSSIENPTLFDYTMGGMGLTGIILRAAIRLRPVETAWIRQTTIAATDLSAVMAAFESTLDSTYSVAWIDCLGSGSRLGRSIVMVGEHAKVEQLPQKLAKSPFRTQIKRKWVVPFDFPSTTLNHLSVRLFNSLYYFAGSLKKGYRLVDWDTFFYPLDSILEWNRIYGKKGFSQFQCVLPLDRSKNGLTALLTEISAAGAGSFLAVLKRFGSQQSAFSFPMEGYTLALDFPVNSKTLVLLDRLDQITIDHGGRFYLAKDSRMSAATLHASDQRVEDMKMYRSSLVNAARFSSTQSERLEL